MYITITLPWMLKIYLSIYLSTTSKIVVYVGLGSLRDIYMCMMIVSCNATKAF